ncbi:hypothetical protein SDC9_121037 [bioreactor metagenome]|uniref:Oxaloacetate decarboxylase gamma chain n=1 Tax=bioreactor metagenome TaxID=1076179 RepID=A0A645CAY4_9ZZZZ
MGTTYSWAQALQLTVMGLSIVFAVLAIIWFTLVIFGVVAKRNANKAAMAQKKTSIAQSPAKAVASAQPAVATSVSESTDSEDEIAAVIAAITAMIGNPSVKVSSVSEWKPNFSNKLYGGINNAKFYSKNKWKSI